MTKAPINVLLLENISPDAVQWYQAENYSVKTINGSLTEEDLIQEIPLIHLLGIRSKTQLTGRVIRQAKNLQAVGAFCIGTKQIDLITCLKNGIPVFNAPYSNTRSVVELTMAEIIVLSRGILEKSRKAHQGLWDKSAHGNREVRGKKLGIIGYGNIGSQLSTLAEANGMSVCYYDIEEKLALGNAHKCDNLKELLVEADVVSIHVDDRPENEHLIGIKEFNQMKKGVLFLNSSRGMVVDLDCLAQKIKSGQIKGAAIDVYPREPNSNSVPFKTILQGLPNVILTPHIGGSTEEAQTNIATFVPKQLISYLKTGNTSMSINFPQLKLPAIENAHRFIHIHRNEPGVLAAINKVFAARQINIVGQYLKTNELIGYMITDVSKNYSPNVIRELEEIQHTIRFRVLY